MLTATAALLALAGGAAWEYIWVEAGQRCRCHESAVLGAAGAGQSTCCSVCRMALACTTAVNTAPGNCMHLQHLQRTGSRFMTTFRSHPDPSEWDNYVDFESTSWPKKDRRRYWIIPSICFNCESACGILAYVDKETMDVRKIEGNPMHPGQPRTDVREGGRHAEPARGSGSHPVSAAAHRRARRRTWERVTWDEALDDIGGRIRKAILEGRRARADVSRRPSGRGRLRQSRAAGVGRRRPQQPHERLLVVGAARALPLVRRRPAVARLRERADDPAALVAPRDRPLLQPARAAHHRGEGERRHADLHRSAAVEHVGEGGPLAAGVLRDRRGAAARDRADPARGGALRPGVRPQVGELARVPARRTAGPARDVRVLHRRAEGAVRAVHARVRRGGNRRAGANGSSRPRARSAAPARASRPTAGAPRRPAICGAGRSRAACTCSSC